MNIYKYHHLVRVNCMTYNHASYILDAMNGFAMQKTDFPYVCIIIDDASNDGTPELILQYLTDHFNLNDEKVTRKEETDDYILTYARHNANINCFFAVLLLKYNHYKKKSIVPYCKDWTANAKYVAICEGDDYWIDPLKLQKQVDILEHNDNTLMCCSGCIVLSDQKSETQSRYENACIVPPEDIIVGGGLWLHTVSYLYNKSLLNDYPDYCRACHVGDFPLVLWAALNGGVYYLPDITATYRYQSMGSWTAKQESFGIDYLIKGWRSEVNMLKGLDIFSRGQYSNAFNSRLKSYIYDALINHKKDANKIIKEFRKELHLLGLRQKIHAISLKMHIEPFYFFLLTNWRRMKRKNN